MNYLNRALKNVTRKLSKSVLLALTFFVIGNFVIVGLGVSNAATQAKVLTRQKMRAVISYEVDYQAFYQWIDTLETDEEKEAAYQNYPYISNEEIQSILADSRVKTVNALTSTTAYSSGFEAVPLNNKREQDSSSSSGTSCWVDADGQEVCEEVVWTEPSVFIKANSYPDMIEFADAMFELKEGRMYTQEEIDNGKEVCLITDTLAEYNNLRIGDTIQISILDPAELNRGNGYYAQMGVTTDDVTMELEIIGIFDNKQEADPTAENFDWMNKYESPENIILLPDTAYLNTQYNLSIKSWEYYQTQFPDDEYYQNEENRPTQDAIMRKSSITILLNDPLDVDQFVEEYAAKLEKDYRKLDANNETFKQLARPLDTLSLFATFIVWLVIINAIIIITLVTALTLKTREYEIGVLLSQGVSKFKIILQFFVELAIVAILGFTLSVLSGSLIANKVGQQVLAYQVDLSGVDELGKEEDDYYYTSVWDESYFSEISLEDMVSQYQVEISPLIIAEIYVAGLGIVLVSILIPSLMIMRFNPKRILMSAQ